MIYLACLRAAAEVHQVSGDHHAKEAHKRPEPTVNRELEPGVEREPEPATLAEAAPDAVGDVHSEGKDKHDGVGAEPPAEKGRGKAGGGYLPPKSTKVEDNQLTSELAERYAENNVIMVTWANNHYHDFVRNWVLNVRKCGVSNFMVGSMDNELLEKLIEDEVPTFAMQSGMTTQDFGWGTANFHLMGRKKIELIYLFTEMGFDILVSDVDTVWMQVCQPSLSSLTCLHPPPRLTAMTPSCFSNRTQWRTWRGILRLIF